MFYISWWNYGQKKDIPSCNYAFFLKFDDKITKIYNIGETDKINSGNLLSNGLDKYGYKKNRQMNQVIKNLIGLFTCEIINIETIGLIAIKFECG